MSVQTVAHLNFHGEAREALEFYASVFGGDLTIATYGDFGLPKELPDAGKVVFGQVAGGNGFQLMAYDVPGETTPATPAPSTHRANGTTITTEKFFLSVRGDTIDEVTAYWKALSEGATVIENLAPARWAPAFGMLTDRFGITWIIDVAATNRQG
ncbi:VOC family protein [Kribbella ginsengisoli]|uniref:VOC family protein n=1 Tax=Kribbella ginsengisoli TaxID=363865 RepID=A0ABP6Z1Z4_9ACTN